MDYLGAEFAGVGFHGGHSVKRAHHTINGSGSEVVSKMLSKAKDLGVDLRLRAKLQRLFRNDAGRIVGLEVRQGYRFPDENSGQPGITWEKSPDDKILKTDVAVAKDYLTSEELEALG